MDSMLQGFHLDVNTLQKLQEGSLAAGSLRGNGYHSENNEDWLLSSAAALTSLEQVRNDFSISSIPGQALNFGNQSGVASLWAVGGYSAGLPTNGNSSEQGSLSMDAMPGGLDVATHSPLPEEGRGPGGLQAHKRAQVTSPTTSDSGALRDNQAGITFSERAAKTPKQEAKLATKSHLTQRRYRERQKAKTADLINKVQQLKEENRVLLEERADLQGRNNMLLQLLQHRDQQVARSQCSPSQFAPLPPPSVPAAPTPAPALRHPLCQQQQMASCGDDLAGALETLTLTVQDQPIRLGPEQVRKLSQKELAKLWRDYVSKLALLLVAAEHQPSAAHLHDRIDQLTGEALLLLTRVSFPNPLGVKHFVSRKLEEDGSVFSREETHEAWLKTALTLGLTNEQQEHTRELRQKYINGTMDLVCKRHEVVRSYVASQPSILSTRVTAANYVKASKLLDALKTSMDDENAQVIAFINNLYQQVLTPLQRARYIVQAYPWTPDHLAFTTAVVAQLGDAEAQLSLSKLLASSHSSPSTGQAKLKLGNDL